MNENPARDIFVAALKLPPEQWEAYLIEACSGDTALLQRVRTLLTAHREAGSFLDPADVGPVGTTTQDVTERPGTVIGPYKLLQQIGEGGMGVVFMAEQETPIHRKVALKVIKPGLDTKQVIARFEAERQALAMMDHVNIARVFDGGTTTGEPGSVSPGRPYFVMELVQGVPITKYCDDNHLTPRERLELFVPVCQAIQHAHQKGVIHRDIKPSNVLVTLYDGRPVPKVIDFGVAKAVEQKLTERTLFTNFGTMVGTLEYMSPEQAEMSALGVDTRSDIYSLGVLLYQLLTGSTPLSRQRLNEAGFAEVLRIIKEEEPQKPSTRLSESGEALASISAQRKMEPAKLTKLVKGELDWIVMKTLEKDRNRRYETATGLAVDVQRYLAGEAVTAVPPSRAYRFRKFVRRNKASVFLVSLIFATLLAGIGGTALGLVHAEEQRRRAEDNANLATKAQARAELGFNKAKEAVEQYLKAVTDDPDLKRKFDLHPLRKKLLNAAVPFYEWFTEQKPGEPAWEAERGKAYGRLAFVCDELDEKEAAVRNYQRKVALFARLAADFPSRAPYRQELADGYHNLAIAFDALGQSPAAEQAYGQAVDVRTKLVTDYGNASRERQNLALSQVGWGLLQLRMGRATEAERSLRDAMETLTKLATDFPETDSIREQLAGCSNNWALLQMQLGRLSSAEAAWRRALELQEGLVAGAPGVAKYRDDLAVFRSNVAVVLDKLGKTKEAEEALVQAIGILEKLTVDFGSLPKHRYALAESQGKLGYVLAAKSRHSEATAAYRRARELLETLVAEFPVIPEYCQELARTENNFATFLRATGQLQDAQHGFNRAIQLQEKLVSNFPKVPQYRLELAYSLINSGDLLAHRTQRTAAETNYRNGIGILEALTEEFPNEPDYRDGLAKGRNNLANLLVDLGRLSAAEQSHRQVLKIREGLTKQFPNVPRYREDLAVSHFNLGVLLRRDARRYSEALLAYRRSIDLMEKLVADFPQAPTYRMELSAFYNNEGNLAEELGDLPASRQAILRCVDLRGKLADEFPQVSQYRLSLIEAYLNLCILLRDHGEAERSLDWYEKAIANLKDLYDGEKNHSSLRIWSQRAHAGRAQALDKLARYQEAIKDWDQAIALAASADQGWGRVQRALSRARMGDHARAVAEADQLAKLQNVPGDSLIDLACLCALASAAVQQDATLREQYANRAITLLRRAIDQGGNATKRLETEKDFDSLRHRDDFQKLMSEMDHKPNR